MEQMQERKIWGKKEEVCYQETKADGDDDSGGYGDSGEIEVTQVAGECLS